MVFEFSSVSKPHQPFVLVIVPSLNLSSYQEKGASQIIKAELVVELHGLFCFLWPYTYGITAPQKKARNPTERCLLTLGPDAGGVCDLAD